MTLAPALSWLSLQVWVLRGLPGSDHGHLQSPRGFLLEGLMLWGWRYNSLTCPPHPILENIWVRCGVPWVLI